MDKWACWRFWKRLRDYCSRRMSEAYMRGGNCDSKCPRCNLWESSGNAIETIPDDDGSEIRTCLNCYHTWRAIFTPAGFVPIKEPPTND